MLEPWEGFSKQYPSYANGTSKRKCDSKWRSFNTTSCDNPLGKGNFVLLGKAR